MFGTFTDHLKQAFDMVWAHGLSRKILQSGMNGTCLRLIIKYVQGY